MSTSSSQSASSSPINTKKRKRGVEDETGRTPCQKKLSKLEQQNKTLQERAVELKRHLVDLRELIDKHSFPHSHLVDRVIKLCDDIRDGAKRRISAFNLLSRQIKPSADDEAVLNFPDTDQRLIYIDCWDQASQTLSEVAKLYEELLIADNSPPSPSEYAQPDVWPEWQQKPTGILNLRPSDKRGLPISTLHPVFARFRASITQPPPETVDTPVALQVAFNLCTTMANSFDHEKLRRIEFKECIQPLFREYVFHRKIPMECTLGDHQSKADLLIYSNERLVLSGEVKLEEGDAYMHMSRAYQTWINEQKDEEPVKLAHGAPIILLCLMGPLLIVAGGFFDGANTIVEPLAEPRLMLPDYHHNRQEQLMRVLFAIKGALKSLGRLDYDAQVYFEPNTPRVYPEFTTFDGQTHNLTFKERLFFGTHGLLFLATGAASSEPLLVKLVADDRYGTNAHRELAKAGHAPILFGSVKVEGSLTAYIMEYLSLTKGWKTLHEYAKDQQKVMSYIQAPLARIMEVMEEKKVAHGDLRPNNIMIRHVKGREPELKVIDFDWAGTSGIVKYPWRRNENIQWPAGPGEPILTEHDRILLERCFTVKPL